MTRDRWTLGTDRLPELGYLVAILTLVALAVTPALMARRVERLQAEIRSTGEPARHLADELRFLFEQEVAQHRGFRSALALGQAGRAEGFRMGYRGSRAAEELVYSRLEPLLRRIGPAATRQLETIRAIADRWHLADDSLAGRRMTLAEFNARLSPQTALRDSALEAAAELQRVTRDAAARAAAGVTTAVHRQRTLSLVLSLAALLAASLVAWLAHRRHILNERLARAVGEQTRLRQESDRRRKELERVTESRARLMRGLSHDLKNPLGAADGFLQLLEEGIDDGLTPHQRESVARARRAIHAALHLIEGLLDLGRAESGRLDIQRVPTDLRAIARETAEEYLAQAAVKGLAIETELPDRLPPIQSDPWRIHEILSNLISNALKYTTHGRITVRVAESRSGGPSAAGHRLELAVRDTGPGIPPEQQQLLFQESVRLEPEAEGGTGVGLSISRRIARALGGDITVESEVGQGSTFTFWLPLDARRTG